MEKMERVFLIKLKFRWKLRNLWEEWIEEKREKNCKNEIIYNWGCRFIVINVVSIMEF